MKERLERMIYLADDRNVVAKFVNGKSVPRDKDGDETAILEEINKVKGSKRDYLNKLFQYVSEAVIRAAVHKNVKKDEFIIRAGEPCDTVYIILKGDVAG